MDLRELRRRIRIVWVSFGVVAFVLLALSFQAHGVPAGTLRSGPAVSVERLADRIVFRPAADTAGSGMVLFPGGMVQPRAYAPLARAVAEAGYTVAIVRLPFLGRHAPTDDYRAEAVERARAFIAGEGPGRRWVIAGHSLGGALAARFAATHPDLVGSLVLMATTHPRDLDLSGSAFPVEKILGSRDGVASTERSRHNAAMLPPSTRTVVIEGANHAHFAYYGPQLGDHRATISREVQQGLVRAELIRVLQGR